MAVNLMKNRLVLLTAYHDVIDECVIIVSDLIARVMYGFCSLKEPKAALPRYILINWVGDDVPDARKCACASHVATIADFFQGVEVIVNASSLEDVEPSAIGQRLTNGTVGAAAVVASPVLSRLKTREEELADVGTMYEKTNAESEMKKINREEFWEQAKREEELRKEEERKKALEERQRFEEERMELEKKEQENREKRYRERERQIEEHSGGTSPVSVHRTEQSFSKEVLIQEATPPNTDQHRDSSGFSVWNSGTDRLVDLWDSSSAPNSAHSTELVDLMGDDITAAVRPQPLLSFDEMMDGTFCSGVGVAEDEQMTLSYRQALQHASGDHAQLLLTNGDALMKEGTQASEGYFSQSQEEDFDSSAKPAPVFYNKPPGQTHKTTSNVTYSSA
uniref:Drebrin 1 n=1 Tax=Gouania willdenowi TaxID=441366 RepID=A0A8C5EMP9_GOUWI